MKRTSKEKRIKIFKLYKPEIIKKDNAKTKYWQKMGYQVFRMTDLDVNEYMKPLLTEGVN